MPPHFTVNMPPSLKSVLKVAVITISPASIYQYTSICTFHNLDEYISQSRQIHLDKYIQKPCWNCHCPCTIAPPAGAMVSLKKQQLGIKRQKWFLRSSKEAGRASRDKDFGRESGHKSTCGGICNRPDLQDCSSHVHLLIIVLQLQRSSSQQLTDNRPPSVAFVCNCCISHLDLTLDHFHPDTVIFVIMPPSLEAYLQKKFSPCFLR